MKKILVVLCILIMTVLSAGCASGEVKLEISPFGSADLSCKILTMPFLQGTLASVRQYFMDDGFLINDASDGVMSGFTASRHFSKVQDVKDTKIIRGFKLYKEEREKAVEPKAPSPDAPKTTPKTEGTPKKPGLVVKPGLLFDTVTLDTELNLQAKKDSPQAKEEKWVVQNLMRQVGLKFILKLPLKVDSTNATRTPDGGNTLEWDLVIGENNPIQAQAEIINPLKAVAWMVLLSAVGVYVIWRYNKKGRAPKRVTHND